MKRLLFVWILTAVFCSCSEKVELEKINLSSSKTEKHRVDVMQASDVAYDFLKGSHTTKSSAAIENLSLNRTFYNDENTPLYYAFNVGKNEGFILVSADDRTVPVLGFTTSGFFDIDNIPDELKILLENYEYELTDIIKDTVNDQPFGPIERIVTKRPYGAGPFITSKWGQGTPYNCLFAPNKAGCAIVAATQILNYHKWPSGLVNWNNIYDDYLKNNYSEAAKREVSSLMVACRKYFSIVDLNGLTDEKRIMPGLKDSLKYNAQLVSRTNYTRVTWQQLMIDELVAERPVLYLAKRYKDVNTTNKVGHAFILHGYSSISDNYALFNINWGWNGRDDGHFLLNGLRPGTIPTHYELENKAIIGISPRK